ncbi:MAG TPA: hypothetical protein PKL00_10625, partial [Bacillota bacterium]|nr:hypothetical protein [Bacillota bacterium]
MKRWHYLTALTILTAAAVIALLSAAEQRAGLIRDLEAENAYLQRRLDQSMKQLQQLTDRIVELEANRALDQALKGTGLAGLGQAFLAAEQEHGVD